MPRTVLFKSSYILGQILLALKQRMPILLVDENWTYVLYFQGDAGTCPAATPGSPDQCSGKKINKY